MEAWYNYCPYDAYAAQCTERFALLSANISDKILRTQPCPKSVLFFLPARIKQKRFNQRPEVSNYLRIQEGSEDGNSSTNSVDGPDLGVEDDNRRDNDSHTLHSVTNAECKWWNLIQRHVWHLIVQMIEYTLSCYPPACHTNIEWVSEQNSSQVKSSNPAKGK